MVDCCDQWEKAAMDIEQEGIRTALFRIGIVLDKNGIYYRITDNPALNAGGTAMEIPLIKIKYKLLPMP
jgi:NAD dependent epimerase/dehydratase family enzyme